MCGLAGIYRRDGGPIQAEQLLAMTRMVRHRGPDDEGFVFINTINGQIQPCYGEETIEPIKYQTPSFNNRISANLAFGFRRLAIIDLSPTGHQPMSNGDGSLWIVYNGEIYNYLELRQELQGLGYIFRTNSDTEVILNAYAQWDTDCLQKFNGMWAFALWDNRRRRLFCARDRFGIKPFFYFCDGHRIIFASEIKQFLPLELQLDLNLKMIYRSLRLNSFLIYSDETFFNQIKILPHSHYLIVNQNNFEIRRYYNLPIAKFENSPLSFQDAQDYYREIFTDAVRLRMRSDVEVGSALSGGLDSSAIVCTAVKFTNQPFQTFTAYYTEEPRYDERRFVELVAQQTGALPHFVSPKPEEMIADFERMTWHNDYPIVGSSFISQYYVMKLVRQHGVTVLLDGQGSDEITAGYNHAFYRYYADLISRGEFKCLLKELPRYLKHNPKGNLFTKAAKITLSLLFRESTLYQQEARRALPNPLSYAFAESEIFQNIMDLPTSRLSNFLYNLMMSTSIQTLLHFEDRNSMAFSIESRVPFLDYRLVEFAFSLPSQYKISGNWSKYIHREALRSIVPPAIIERRDKVNFAAPGEKYWLRRELQPVLADVLHSEKFLRRSIYNHKVITTMYKRFLTGEERLSPLIWRIFALEEWLRVFND